MKKILSKFFIGSLIVSISVTFYGCTNSNKTNSEENKSIVKSQVITETKNDSNKNDTSTINVNKDLDKAVSEAIIKKEGEIFSEKEYETEAHITLGTEVKNNKIYVYTAYCYSVWCTSADDISSSCSVARIVLGNNDNSYKLEDFTSSYDDKSTKEILSVECLDRYIKSTEKSKLSIKAEEQLKAILKQHGK